MFVSDLRSSSSFTWPVFSRVLRFVLLKSSFSWAKADILP